jgi:hypothetical protein
LPRAALDKGFAEGLRGFAESLGPSAKQPAPVVTVVELSIFSSTTPHTFDHKRVINICRFTGSFSETASHRAYAKAGCGFGPYTGVGPPLTIWTFILPGVFCHSCASGDLGRLVLGIWNNFKSLLISFQIGMSRDVGNFKINEVTVDVCLGVKV